MTKTTAREFALTPDQENVLAWLTGGFNVFLTGVAGTGKTMCLNHWLDNLPPNRNVGIAASTGIAATHIGGSTLHSWLGATPERNTMTRLCNGQWLRKYGPRLKAVHALIIDEISMVDAELFTLAEGAHRAARESVLPWGGVQVILVGDLGQLPPVEAEEKGWCFQSPAWADSKIQVLELTQVMRQGDQRFADLLRRIRVGYVDDEVVNVLASRRGAFDPDSPGTVRLVTHNAQCDEVNDSKLAQVPGKEYVFRARDTGTEPHLSALKKSCLSPEVLRLKVGARVMFTKNDFDGAWVNGTMGEVMGFGGAGDIDVRLNDGEIVSVQPVTWGKKQWEDETTLRDVASRTQYPLRLAWAITIHKCVHPDTLVTTEEGLIPLGEAAESGRIATLSGMQKYSNYVRNPVRSGLRIVTRRGFELAITPEHGLMASKGDGPFARVDANALVVGDRLRLARGMSHGGMENLPLPPATETRDTRRVPFRVPEKMSAELAEFLGLMVADGTLYKRGFRLAKRHADVVARFAKLGGALFGLRPKLSRPKWTRADFAEFNSTPVADWLRAVGGMAPNAKAVPSVVLRSPEAIQRAFLRGLFEDGSVHVKRENFSHIEWSTASERMSHVVQVMLLHLGIFSSRRCVTRVMRGEERSSWRLWIYGADARAFVRKIGFVSSFKMCRAQYALDVDEDDDLEELVSDKIVSIERIEMPSVCVTVPYAGRFIQGGFDGFNSQGMTIDRVSMDLSRTFSPGQAYVALSRCRTLEGINIEAWQGAESIVAHPMLRQAVPAW